MDDNVTPIRPGILPTHEGAPASTTAELSKLMGYDGSIQGSPLESALEEQRMALWEAQAVIENVAHAIEREFGHDWPNDRPHFPLALRLAARMINSATGRMEAGTLEERGLAIARAAEVSNVSD